MSLTRLALTLVALAASAFTLAADAPSVVVTTRSWIESSVGAEGLGLRGQFRSTGRMPPPQAR
jgi:hypothetical protein